MSAKADTAYVNQVKSTFISFYPVVALGLTVLSAWQILATGNVLGWVGTLATSAPFLMFLGYIMLFRNVARTSANLPSLNALALAGMLLAGYATYMSIVQPVAFTLAIVGSVTFALYSMWYSKLGRAPSSRIIVGKALPELELRRADGDLFYSSELHGRPALLMFYRGNWCPLCVAQIKELAARFRELAEYGARVILVSPQPDEKSTALAKRFNVPFDFMTDPGNKVARGLGIEMKNGLPLGMAIFGYENDTVFPTVLVTDRQGIVRWIDQTDNYRVRPEPETFLVVLRQLATEPAQDHQEEARKGLR